MSDWSRSNVLTLSLVTLSYVVGEIAHFLIAVTSKSVANDIGYGTKKCFTKNEDDVVNKTDDTDCSNIDNREE